MDNRIVLTHQKIQERLQRDVKKRIKFDVIIAIIGGIFLLVFGIIALDCHLKQDPALVMVLGLTAVLVLIVGGFLCAELVTVSRLKRCIEKREYIVLHDKLIRANEHVKQIEQKPVLHPGYRGHRTVTYVDEYIFESGMKYVRSLKSPDEFDMSGIMRYSDDPVPFVVIVYRDRPSAPILLFNELVYRFEENENA